MPYYLVLTLVRIDLNLMTRYCTLAGGSFAMFGYFIKGIVEQLYKMFLYMYISLLFYLQW